MLLLGLAVWFATATLASLAIGRAIHIADVIEGTDG